MHNCTYTQASTHTIQLPTANYIPAAKQGHLCITWNFQLAKPLKKNKSSSVKFLLRKGQYEKINEMFKEINWVELFHDKPTTECYNIFQEKYNEASNKFIPKKNQTNTPSREPRG